MEAEAGLHSHDHHYISSTVSEFFLPAGRYSKPIPGGLNYGYLYLTQATVMTRILLYPILYIVKVKSMLFFRVHHVQYAACPRLRSASLYHVKYLELNRAVHQSLPHRPLIAYHYHKSTNRYNDNFGYSSIEIFYHGSISTLLKTPLSTSVVFAGLSNSLPLRNVSTPV